MYRVIIKTATFELIDVQDQIDSFESLFGIKNANDESLTSNFEDLGFESKDPTQNLQVMFFVLLSLAGIPVLLKVV